MLVWDNLIEGATFVSISCILKTWLLRYPIRPLDWSQGDYCDLRLLLSPRLTMYLLLDLLLRMSNRVTTTRITTNKMTRKPPIPTPTPMPMLLLLSEPTTAGRVVSPCVIKTS